MDLPHGYRARQARASDAEAAGACVRAAYEHYIARNGKVPAPMLDDYAEIIPEHDVTVIERDGEIVAVLLVREESEGFLLDNVAVLPACQGAGLGRYLLRLAERKAREAGYDSIYLYTQDIMTENQAIYRRIGYIDYARRTELGLNRIYMRKQLGPGD